MTRRPPLFKKYFVTDAASDSPPFYLLDRIFAACRRRVHGSPFMNGFDLAMAEGPVARLEAITGEQR